MNASAPTIGRVLPARHLFVLPSAAMEGNVWLQGFVTAGMLRVGGERDVKFLFATNRAATAVNAPYPTDATAPKASPEISAKREDATLSARTAAYARSLASLATANLAGKAMDAKLPFAPNLVGMEVNARHPIFASV